VSLDDVVITNTFPSDEVVFTRGSGEVAGGGASIRLTGTTSPVGPLIITLNRFGVIQSVN